MTPVERRILIKVSTMYYLEHMKQTEIAKRLGVERTTKVLSQLLLLMKVLRTLNQRWKSVSG